MRGAGRWVGGAVREGKGERARVLQDRRRARGWREPGRVDVDLPQHERADAEPRGRLEALDDRPFLEPLRRALLSPLLLPVHDRRQLRLEPCQAAGGDGVVCGGADHEPAGGLLLALLEGCLGPSGGLEVGDVWEWDLWNKRSSVRVEPGQGAWVCFKGSGGNASPRRQQGGRCCVVHA